MSGFIYLITNAKNGKKYVGKTINSVEERFRGHVGCAKSNHQSILYSAMRKYGPENFNVSVLEVVESDLDSREIFHIADQKAEYNMTKGGGGWIPTTHYRWINDTITSRRLRDGLDLPVGFDFGILDSTKAKISLANLGKALSPATVAKIVAKTRGGKRSEETKEKQRAKALLRKHSEETKAEMSRTRKGRETAEEAKAKLRASAAAGWAKRRAKMVSSALPQAK